MAGNWSNGVPVDPSLANAPYAAVIGDSSSVTLDGYNILDANNNEISPVIIDKLIVGPGSSLGLSSSSLQLGDPSFGTLGALVNKGSIDLQYGTLTIDSSSGMTGSSNNRSFNSGTLNLDNGTLAINDGGKGVTTSLNGGGTIQLNYGTIQGVSGDELFAVNGTIQGTGTIGAGPGPGSLALETTRGGTLMLDESAQTGGSGTLYLTQGSTLQTNGGNLILLGSDWNASGNAAVDNQGGTITIGSANALTFKGTPAGGLFQLSNEGAINLGGNLVLDANGGGASSSFQIVGSSPGTLTLSGGTIQGANGTVSFTNGANSTVQGNGTIASTVAFTNTGNVVADGGTLTLGNSSDYKSGTLSGPGTFTANGAILQFGNMGAGTGIATNASTIVLNGTGAFQNAVGGDALSSYLTTNSGTLTLQNGANLTLTTAFNNTNGTLNVLANSALNLNGIFTNAAGEVLNGGTYTIGGTLNYRGQDITMIGSTTSLTLEGSGNIVNTAGSNPDALSHSLTTNNGTLTLTGTLQNPTTVTLSQAFTNTNGTLNVLANSTLNLNGIFTNAAGGVLNGGTYTIGGTLNYSGQDITAIGATTSLTLEGSGNIVNTAGSNPDALSHSLTTNNGTLTLTGTLQNPTTVTLSQAFTNTNGTLNVLANSTLNLNGGFTNAAGGALNGGTYTIGGTLNYSGLDITAINTGTSLTLDGNGGASTGAIMNASGGSHNALTGTLATNYGTLMLQNNANVALTTAFTNSGNLNILSNSTLDLTQPGGALGNIDSNGVLNGGTYEIAGVLLYNGPAITTIGQTASLTLDVGNSSIMNASYQDQLANSLTTNKGTLTLQNGAYLGLSQTFTNQGNLVVLANSVLDLTQPGGAFGNVDSNGVLKGGSYLIGGTVQYSGANIVTLYANTSLTLDGNGVIVNTATDFNVTDTLATNNGTLRIQNGDVIQGSGFTFTNTGSTTLVTGSSLIEDSIINSGSVTVDGTSVLQSTGNYTQTSGSTQMDGLLIAAEVDVQGNTLDSTVDGTGTIDGTLLNEGGTVAPGDNAPGVLTVTDFTQTSGDLLFDIQGTLPGIDYSQLLVNGAAAFGGNIEFDFLNGFMPQIGQIYTLIAYESFSGTFDSYTIDNLSPYFTADITYGADDVQVSFTEVTPEPASIALMLAGLGVIGFAWRRRTHCRGSH
jgi:hypothetical protein